MLYLLNKIEGRLDIILPEMRSHVFLSQKMQWYVSSAFYVSSVFPYRLHLHFIVRSLAESKAFVTHHDSKASHLLCADFAHLIVQRYLGGRSAPMTSLLLVQKNPTCHALQSLALVMALITIAREYRMIRFCGKRTTSSCEDFTSLWQFHEVKWWVSGQQSTRKLTNDVLNCWSVYYIINIKHCGWVWHTEWFLQQCGWIWLYWISVCNWAVMSRLRKQQNI